MKVIIFSKEGIYELLAHFIAYGYTDFIVYTDVDKGYYEMNGINVTKIVGFELEDSGDRLMKIKGSLCDSFFVIYSSEITNVDIDSVANYHRKKQGIATLIEINKKLIGALTEPEIFDYIENTRSLEREVFLKVGQDGELAIYN